MIWCMYFMMILKVYSEKCTLTMKVEVPGNAYVIALYSNIHQPDDSGLDTNALRLHLKLRYFIARQHYLKKGNFTVGFIAHNVCNNATRLNEILTEIYIGRKFQVFHGKKNRSSKCNCSVYQSNVFSVISYMSDELTRQAADFMEIEKIPYFAYTEKKLNSDNSYKNFYSIYDIINNEVGKTFEEIRAQNFRTIVLLHVGEKQNYITKLHQNQLLKKLAGTSEFCVQSKTIGDKNESESQMLLEKIKQNSEIELVVLWSDVNAREKLLKTIDRLKILNKSWFWYSSEQFNLSIATNISKDTMENMFVFYHPLHAYQLLHQTFTYEAIKEKCGTSYEAILKDDWIKELMKVHDIDPHKEGAFKILDTRTTYEEEYIENVLLILWWAQPFSKIQKWSMKDLLNHIHYLATRRNYTMISRLEKNKKIVNLKQLKYGQSNVSTCKLISCSPGTEAKHGYQNGSIWQVEYEWSCAKCQPNFFKNTYGYKHCMKCPTNYTSSFDSTSCYDPYKDVYLKYNHPKIVVFLVCLLLAILFNMFAIIMFIVYKSTPVVRSSNSRTSLIQLTFHLMLYISLPFVFIGAPNVMKCISQSIITGFFLTVITSITLKKTQQLLFAFQADRKLTRDNIFMSEAVELTVVLFLLLVQITISVVYFIEKPPDIKVKYDQILVFRYVSCHKEDHVDIQLYYIFILCMFCVIQGIRARKLPKYFNETKFIAFSMFISILILSIRFPIYYSYKLPHEKTYINLVVIMLLNTCQLVIMYVHKLYMILFCSKKNTKAVFRIGLTSRSRFSTRVEIFYGNQNYSPKI